MQSGMTQTNGSLEFPGRFIRHNWYLSIIVWIYSFTCTGIVDIDATHNDYQTYSPRLFASSSSKLWPAPGSAYT